MPVNETHLQIDADAEENKDVQPSEEDRFMVRSTGSSECKPAANAATKLPFRRPCVCEPCLTRLAFPLTTATLDFARSIHR